MGYTLKQDGSITLNTPLFTLPSLLNECMRKAVVHEAKTMSK